MYLRHETRFQPVGVGREFFTEIREGRERAKDDCPFGGYGGFDAQSFAGHAADASENFVAGGDRELAKC